MYRQETARIYAIARHPDFRLIVTKHAEERMLKWDIARFDIERILKTGAVIMIDREPSGEEMWRIAGGDERGPIFAVIKERPPKMAILITVINSDRRKKALWSHERDYEDDD